MPPIAYKDSVFLNVPFDTSYKPIFNAIVFTVFDCGFVSRSALESDDAAQVRIQKIYELISLSKYGIRDISRTGLDSRHKLPRFNMPLELGIFLGARTYGQGRHRDKRALVLDRDQYRYQKYCSDIAGQDIRSHQNQIKVTIRCIRDWLRASPDTAGKELPSGEYIYSRFLTFRQQLPRLCQTLKLEMRALQYNDYTILVSGWLKANPR